MDTFDLGLVEMLLVFGAVIALCVHQIIITRRDLDR
jgi:hypothetical protein